MKICRSNGMGGIRLTLAALTAAAALGAVTAPALAQDNTPAGYLSAEETMSCICWEEEMAQVDADLNGPEIGALHNEYNRVDELLRQAHANLDTADKAEVESVQRISERWTQLKQQLDQARFPLLRRKVALTTNYNNLCAGRRMFAMNVDAARANPQCPATP
jgi:hypothetical protein